MREKLALLERTPEPAINRAAQTSLDLRETWEWATKEERGDLVRTILQEVGCDVGTKRIVWVKVNPDCEILFRLMDRLQPEAGRRYWVREQDTEGNVFDIEEEIGQMVTEVKIGFPMSHNTLTSVEEYVQ